MLTANKQNLKNLLQKVKPLCNRKTNSAISNHVLLTVTDNRLELQATDFESAFVGSITVESQPDTRMMIPFAKFFDIVSNMPTDTISINNDDNWIAIESGGANFHIAGSSEVDSFPVFQEQEIGQWYTTDNLDAALDMAGVVAEAPNDHRSHIAGALIVSHASGLEIVSTDSSRLHRILLTIDQQAEGVRSLPAKKGLRDVQNFIKGAPSVSIAFEKSAMYFKCGDDILRIRELEGSFPVFEDILNSCRDYPKFTVDTYQVQSTLKRMAVMVSDSNKGVVVSANGSEMSFYISNPDLGEAKESMPCEAQFNEVVINLRYMLEAMNYTGETTTIAIKNEKSPIYVCNGDGSFESVIMPMRL